jgi:hypothetical protein
MKAIFGLWGDIRVSQINRLLRPHGVRLVAKYSRDWGDQVNITAHKIEEPTKPSEPLPPGVETP